MANESAHTDYVKKSSYQEYGAVDLLEKIVMINRSVQGNADDTFNIGMELVVANEVILV